MPPSCTVLPCTEASVVSGLNRGLQLTVPSHRRELQTQVSTVASLTSALANTAVGRIILASGTYYLSAELSITRSVILEATVAGSVVLDAQGSSSNQRRVLNVNPGSLGVVQLIGLKITRGYVCSCSKFPIAPMGKWLTRFCLDSCLCICERFGQLQWVRAAETFKSSHRPDGKMADVLASTLARTTATDALVNYRMCVPQRP